MGGDKLARIFVVTLFCVVVSGCLTTSRWDELTAENRPLDVLLQHPESPPDIGQPTLVASVSPHIEWEVLNRFRLLTSEQEEERFYRDLSAYIAAYYEWFGKESGTWIMPNILATDLLRLEQHPGDHDHGNYLTHYMAEEYHYDQAWVRDPVRRIRATFVGVAEGSQCTWVTASGEKSGPCQAFEFDARIDTVQHVTATAGSVAASADVEPRDVKIVALGDSFSAGEGNPHSRWRISGAWSQASLWLDARCHRSLMSSPSLVSAFVARHNPHLSVTLLHYGCSGASVADGVLGPWSYLEPSETVDDRNRFYNRNAPTQPRAGYADVGRSQINQAHLDLGGAEPDIVLVATGGNDIGFAGVVIAMAAQFGARQDLRPGDPTAYEMPHDARTMAPYDEAIWAHAGHETVSSCRNGDRQGYLDCLHARISERMQEQLRADRNQYDRLAEGLSQQLVSDPSHVIIAEYPSMFERRPAPNAEPIPCIDRPFDGRPALIPGVLAWIPGLGLREDAMHDAFARIIAPLDAAIAGAAHEHDWQVVSEHVDMSRSFGFCSLQQRHYNTMLDSAWSQGIFNSRGRPVGVFTVLRDGLQPENSTGPATNDLRAGEVVVWDVDGVTAAGRHGCYKRATFAYQPIGECIPGDDHGALATQYVLDWQGQREAKGWPYASGVVHPTLYGHCGYAAAMLPVVVGTARDKLDPDFIQSLQNHSAGLDFICSPPAWGWRWPHY